MTFLHQQYRVHQCSKCSGDTEYFCFTCLCDLCLQCKEKHLKYFKTRGHNVVIFREKFSHIPMSEMCARHPNKVYRRFCEPCQVPVCERCSDHNIPKFRMCLSYFRQTKHHEIIGIRLIYRVKRQKQRKIITIIRSGKLLYRNIIAEIRADVQKKISFLQLQMLTKAMNLIDMINNELCDNSNEDYIQLIQTLQNEKMNNTIANLQLFELKYEQSAMRSLQFLKRVHDIRISKKMDFYGVTHNIEITVKESLDIREVIKWLTHIQIT